MNNSKTRASILTNVLLFGLTAVFLLVIVFSLKWPLLHDSPIMLYQAYLMDAFDKIPYKDFFDMNMPGTHLAFYSVAGLFGYSDRGFRIADLSFMAVILLLSWLWMKQFGKKAAWGGCLLFALAYLHFGPAMSLQREYLILVPVILSILISTRMTKPDRRLRFLIAGLLFGAAATVKPHSCIGLAVLLCYEYINKWRNKNPLRSRLKGFLNCAVFPAIIGLVIPLAAIVLYLWSKGSLGAFIDIASRYWPLYTHLSGDHRTIDGLERYVYLVNEWRRLGDMAIWLPAAAVGAFAACYHAKLEVEQRRQVYLMLGLMICYSIYPVFSGQFWPYHRFLFLYFIVQLSALCLVRQNGTEYGSKNLFLLLVLLVTLFCGGLKMPPGFWGQLRGKPLILIKSDRAEQIASFLKNNIKPGDTVQPLDWTGGAVHAMLLSRAPLATRFVYDFHFYHHISNPYIQGLRAELIRDLNNKPPRFIIQITSEDKPWVSGRDTTREFTELQELLGHLYKIASQGSGYVIYARE